MGRARPAPNSASTTTPAPVEHVGRERLDTPGEALGHGGGIFRQPAHVAVEAEPHSVAPLQQMPRGNEAITAIIAGTAKDDDALLVGEALGDLVGHGATRVLHERRAGDAARDGKRVGTGHLVGGQKLEHQFCVHNADASL